MLVGWLDGFLLIGQHPLATSHQSSFFTSRIETLYWAFLRLYNKYIYNGLKDFMTWIYFQKCLVYTLYKLKYFFVSVLDLTNCFLNIHAHMKKSKVKTELFCILSKSELCEYVISLYS